TDGRSRWNEYRASAPWMHSVVTSFGIARRDATVLPCAKGAVSETAPFFVPANALPSARRRVSRECREAVPADREDDDAHTGPERRIRAARGGLVQTSSGARHERQGHGDRAHRERPGLRGPRF